MTNPAEPVIGLTMIVKDEAETILACLDSVLPHVDHAVIVDTGSTDDTRRLIQQAADRHGHGPKALHTAKWPGHFGRARQHALDLLLRQHPDVTHILWLDGDDVLVGGGGLRSLAEQLQPPMAGVLCHYAYAHDPAGNLACSHFRERLVRVDAIAGWTGAVHEVLTLQPGWTFMPAAAPTTSTLRQIPTSTWPRGEGGVEVIHTRPPAKDTTGRNRVILQAEVDEARAGGREPDPRSLYYLSQELAIAGAVEHDELVKAGKHDAAREALDSWLGQAVAMLDEHAASSGWDEETYQGLHRGGDYLRMLNRPGDALQRELRAIEVLPDWPDAWLGAAESYMALGKPAVALAYVDAGLAKPYPQTMLILNPLDYTVAAWTTRGLALNALGRVDEALTEIRRAVAAAPHDQGLAHNEFLFSEQVNRQRLKEALLALDEGLARHDENLAAARLLEEAVPYFLRDDPDVAARRQRRRAGVRHVRQVAGNYQRFYGDDNEFIPITLATRTETPREAVDWLCVEQALPRAQHLLAGLREQAGGDDLSGLSVLDLGCNDGWLGWWLCAYHGLGSYHGFDLNDRAIAAATSYAEHFPEAAGRVRFTLGDIFDRTGEQADAVVSFEVIEHVPDPGDFLDGLARLAHPAGRVYISTPNGAFERGNISDWDTPSPRGHVRAMRARDLTGLMLDRGLLESFEETRDGLLVASFTPAPRIGTLDFYLGPAAGTWAPFDVATKGLGGSETMAVRMASRLAERGWRVRLFGEVDPQAVQGVEYLPHYLFDPVDPRDVLIGSRVPGLIERQPNARHRILWLHDADYPDLERLAPLWDEVWTVGQWQADHLPLGGANVRVTRNGVALSRFPDGARGFEEREPWAVYASSPDRGLLTLLDLWPEVYDQAAARGVEPQLHIAYGFTPTYDAMQRMSPHLAETRREIEARLSMPGVVWRGSLGQEDLATLEQQARVWAYPTDFPEVSCITGMEAQAAGLACLTTSMAELPRTVEGPGLWPPAAEWTPEERAEYIDALARSLTVEAYWRPRHALSLAARDRFDLEVLADEWDALLRAATSPPIRVARSEPPDWCQPSRQRPAGARVAPTRGGTARE